MTIRDLANLLASLLAYVDPEATIEITAYFEGEKTTIIPIEGYTIDVTVEGKEVKETVTLKGNLV